MSTRKRTFFYSTSHEESSLTIQPKLHRNPQLDPAPSDTQIARHAAAHFLKTDGDWAARAKAHWRAYPEQEVSFKELYNSENMTESELAGAAYATTYKWGSLPRRPRLA